jgi:hypothetical protein
MDLNPEVVRTFPDAVVTGRCIDCGVVFSERNSSEGGRGVPPEPMSFGRGRFDARDRNGRDRTLNCKRHARTASHFRRLDPHDVYNVHDALQVVALECFGRRTRTRKDGDSVTPLGSRYYPTPPPRAGDGDRETFPA